MVASVSKPLNSKPARATRHPLLPSNPAANAVVSAGASRPKSREVTSRYLSSSSSTPSSNSKLCPSPAVSRTAASTMLTTPRRSQSVERRRAAAMTTPRPSSAAGEMTSASKKLLVTSSRSLSVSFQGESYSLQVSKAKPTPSPSPAASAARKSTPERRKVSSMTSSTPESENSRPMEQYRRPARLRPDTCMTKSLDCTAETRRTKKANGSGSNVVRALQNDLDGRLRSISCDLGSAKKAAELIDEAKSLRVTTSEAVALSDTDSVSSGSSNSGPHELRGALGQTPQTRGVVVPARVWKETNSLVRAKTTASPKVDEASRLSPRGVVNSRGQISPICGSVRPASPSKLSRPSVSSPSRGVSPSRIRNGVSATSSSHLSNMTSVLSFAVDVRRGRTGEEQIGYAHVLRLVHNRQLQLRFVNARANAALSAQKFNAERSLYNAWITTSKLRESVRAKRTQLQLMRQNLKLVCILQGQMIYLEECSLLDPDFSTSLSGAIEALRASTLRLPVVDGARADVNNVKDTISSAFDVMQAMASSICLLLSKIGEVNSLADELASASVKEHALLGQSRDLLSTVAAMQVEEFSLRTHILQQQRVPSSLTVEV